MNTSRFLLYFGIIFIAGCANFRTDVSKQDSLWLPYHRHTTYVLTEDVFLIKIEKGEGQEPSRVVLVPPSDDTRGSGYYSSPKSIQEYLDHSETIPKIDAGLTGESVVRGIVRKGTRFSPSVLKKNSGFSLWFGKGHTDITQYGKILDGEFAGTNVELSDVSWEFSQPKKLSKAERLHRLGRSQWLRSLRPGVGGSVPARFWVESMEIQWPRLKTSAQQPLRLCRQT
ncbi:MAG: hypothetical protein ABJC04_13745 [Verrucomicrobiota bacterium]